MAGDSAPYDGEGAAAPPEPPVLSGAGLPSPHAPGEAVRRVPPYECALPAGEFPRWGGERGVRYGGGRVRGSNAFVSFRGLRRAEEPSVVPSDLGQAEGSSPRHHCFLHGALPRFGVLPAFSECPAQDEKNTHSCLECLESELILLQLRSSDVENS